MTRPALNDLGLASGKRTRIYRMLYQHGLRNGTAMVLPYDQGLEHGPRDFATHPPSGDPAYILRLAVDGGFNAVAVGVGIAEKYFPQVAGEIPLILKLNGKTEIPPDEAPLSPLTASVSDAVRIGADAVGYTLYVGSPRQDVDFTEFRQVRQDCERAGMPLMVWAYPRGAAVTEAGGKDSFWAVDYAARVASELGADLVKVNYPDPQGLPEAPAPYDTDRTPQEALEAVVGSAGRALTLLSGGARAEDGPLLDRVEQAMAAGAAGVVFGRNVWQRPRTESLAFVAAVRNILARHPARLRASTRRRTGGEA